MIQVDAARSKQLNYIGLRDEDLVFLKEQRKHFEEITDVVVDRLYDNVNDQPELAAIIQKHSTIDRLKETQRWYFMTMTDGVIDAEFIEKRLYIGKLHSKIGLTTNWYLGTYMLYLDIATQQLQGDCSRKLDEDRACSLQDVQLRFSARAGSLRAG